VDTVADYLLLLNSQAVWATEASDSTPLISVGHQLTLTETRGQSLTSTTIQVMSSTVEEEDKVMVKCNAITYTTENEGPTSNMSLLS